MDLKLSEFVRERLVGFLEAECLVGDIYTGKRKKKKGAKTQKYNTNLISVKKVKNRSTTL